MVLCLFMHIFTPCLFYLLADCCIIVMVCFAKKTRKERKTEIVSCPTKSISRYLGWILTNNFYELLIIDLGITQPLHKIRNKKLVKWRNNYIYTLLTFWIHKILKRTWHCLINV